MTDSELLAERIKHEKEMREALAEEVEKALGIQATETARRLHELNEAHKRAADDRSMFMAKDAFEVFAKDYRDKHAVIVDALSRQAGLDERSRRNWAAAVVFVTVVINIIALLFAFDKLAAR